MSEQVLVVIESPLRGAVPEWVTRWLPVLAPFFERRERARNRRYACDCMRHALGQGELPYASIARSKGKNGGDELRGRAYERSV